MAGLSMYEYLNQTAFVVATSVFCALTILSNLCLMISILASPSLRSSPKHVLIFTLCLADLYTGVAELPFLAQFYSLEKWIHDPKYLQIMDNSQYKVLTSFRTLLHVGICGHTIMSMFTSNKRFMMLMSGSMIVGFLLYSLVLVLPAILTNNFSPTDPFYWTLSGAIDTASFFPQAVVMVVLVVNILILTCSRSFDDVGMDQTRTFPADVVVACAVMLIFTTPLKVVLRGYSSCSSVGFSCRRMHIVRGITLQLASARHCVSPFVWLLSKETRQGVFSVCRRNQPPPYQQGLISNITKYEMQTENKNTRL